MKTIDILGPILSDREKEMYDSFGFESAGTSPSSVREVLNKAKADEDIEVRINSPGGDVFSGSEIFTMLAERKNVHIKIIGLAASAASVIACAGESEISPSGAFMIHNVQTTAAGDFNVMEKTKQTLLTVSESILNVYERKTGLPRSELEEMMNNTTWMSPQDCVRLGFIDRIMFDGNTGDDNNGKDGNKASSAGSTTFIGSADPVDDKAAKATARLHLIKLKSKGDFSYD